MNKFITFRQDVTKQYKALDMSRIAIKKNERECTFYKSECFVSLVAALRMSHSAIHSRDTYASFNLLVNLERLLFVRHLGFNMCNRR